MRYPIDPPILITQTYAAHLLVRESGRNPTYNPGIDLAVEVGTPVMAFAPGSVSYIEGPSSIGYGCQVRIDHGNGMLSIYAHLSETRVVMAQMVAEGQVIGLSGNTGMSTGPHLHFEVRLFDTPVDPLPLVSGEELVAAGLGSLPLGLPMAKMLYASQNMRAYPSANAPLVRSIQRKPGLTLPVIGAAWIRVTGQDDPDLWLCMGYMQWMVCIFGGKVFMTIEGTNDD